ncbi:MAG TPA: DNA replication/repair protein RecF [Ignavibacteriaceae bacterium]|nr:DNA replication/repair protein RecF [Ignavibacteriaceae bacterium]
MILSSVKLKNFRSHKETKLIFSERLNYIVGGNGQGKTSILESIYYLCTTKSINSNFDGEVVRFNENELEIIGSFKDYSNSEARISYSLNSNKKIYFLNGKHITRAADIIGKFPVVILTPTDHSITQGAPGERRKFVDSVISQASETYLKNLLDYNKTLRQKASLLAQLKETKNKTLFDELDAWNSKMIASGKEIIIHRLKFIRKFKDFIKDSFKVILNDDEIPGVEYMFLEGLSQEENIEDIFFKLLHKRKDDEIRRGSNLVGPHRDDFVFKINDVDLKTYGSQGQHKTFQVVLRFAQFFYLKEITGKAPIFLLDDVFGELDAKRSIRISEYLRQVGQAFITLTDFTDFSFLKKEDDDLVIKLNNGQVVYA